MPLPSIADLTTELSTFLSATWRAFRVFLAVLRSGPAAEAVPAEKSRTGYGLRLPHSYGRTRLVVLPVDPYTLHAYWEISPSTVAEAEKRLHAAAAELQPALRLHESGASLGNDAPWFDVPIHLGARNWFVPLWAPGRGYRVELGLKSAAGDFAALARSELVQTPRAWPEATVREHFMRVAGDERRAVMTPTPDYGPPLFVAPRVFLPPAFAAALRSFGRLGHVTPEQPATLEPRQAGGAAGTADLAGLAEDAFVPGISSMPSSSSLS